MNAEQRRVASDRAYRAGVWARKQSDASYADNPYREHQFSQYLHDAWDAGWDDQNAVKETAEMVAEGFRAP